MKGGNASATERQEEEGVEGLVPVLSRKVLKKES